MPTTVRPVTPADAAVWLALRCALWPDGAAEHPAETAAFFAGEAAEPLAVLLAEADGTVVGLVELSLRPFADGCDSSPVGYVEGWYVVPERRRCGIGRTLLAAAAAWARDQGCSELASDTEVDNAVSTAAHLALGFEEVAVIRCFRRPLR
jgi:aminoglycoside 6'-N-acetyltransferase I